MSQSAIAQAMQSLERHLGCVLFEPAGRRKLPTVAALDAARRAAELQRGAASLPGAWEESLLAPGVPRLRLRVGVALAAVLLYAPDAARERS